MPSQISLKEMRHRAMKMLAVRSDCGLKPRNASGKNGFSTRATGGSKALPTFRFWTFGLQNCESFCFVKPVNLWSFVTVALMN